MKSKQPTVAEMEDYGPLVQVFPLLAHFASQHDLAICMDNLMSWALMASARLMNSKMRAKLRILIQDS